MPMLSIRLSAMCPIYKVPSSLTTDPFCNAEARAAWSLRDRSRIALTRGGSRAIRPLTLAIIVLRSRRAAVDGKEVGQSKTARSEDGVAAAGPGPGEVGGVEQ